MLSNPILLQVVRDHVPSTACEEPCAWCMLHQTELMANQAGGVVAAPFWEDTAMLWEQRWQQAFTPNNNHFSGHLPTLRSSSAALRRIYYNSLLTVVSLERTNLPLVAERVYLTAAGNALPYNCATCFPHIDGMLEVGAAASYCKYFTQQSTLIELLLTLSEVSISV